MAIFNNKYNKKDYLIKNVVMYTRVSTKDQVLGFSLSKQMEDIQQYCKKENYNIIEHFSDQGITGKSTEKRYAYQDMLDYISTNKIDAIIVWKLSRISRKVKDLLDLVEILDSNNIALISIQDGLNTSNSQFSKILLMVLGMVAELEGDNIVIQSNAGMIQRAKEGKFMGGTPPFGYKYSNDEKGLSVDAEQSLIIQKIFADFVICDKSLTQIKNELLILNIKTEKGNLISNSTLSYILQNPIYTGKYQWNKKNKETEDTIINYVKEWTIIENDLFEKAQEKLITQKHSTPRKDGKFLLTGLIVCPICGKFLTGDSGTSKTGKTHEYYSCKNTKAHKRYTLKKDEIEQQIVDKIGTTLIEGNFAAKIKNFDFGSKTKELNNEINLIKKNIKETQNKMKDTIDLKLKDLITENNLKMIMSDYNTKIENLNSLLITKEFELQKSEGVETNINNIEQILMNFYNIFIKSQLSLSEKNRLIKLIVSKITIYLSDDFKVRKIKEIELSFTDKIVRLDNSWQGVQESNP